MTLETEFFQFLLRAVAVRAGPVLQLAAFSIALWLILRGLRWQFGLELFQHAHGSLTIALPMVILAGDVLSGQLEVGRVIDCRWNLQAASGYR